MVEYVVEYDNNRKVLGRISCDTYEEATQCVHVIQKKNPEYNITVTKTEEVFFYEGEVR